MLGQATADREAVIRRCGRMLVDSGYAATRYIEGMIKRDNEISTAIGNYIAIPHAGGGYKAEIISTGLVVLAYPEPLDWQGKPVHLVIAIAARGDEHLEIMGNIADTLETGEDTMRLVLNTGIDDVYRLLAGGAWA
jgi:mannitol/fructose-specific phosphotransferase system IIA component